MGQGRGLGEGWAGEGGVDSHGMVADDTPGSIHGGKACWREGGGVWGVLGECNSGGCGVDGYSRYGVHWEGPGWPSCGNSWVGSGWVEMHEPRWYSPGGHIWGVWGWGAPVLGYSRGVQGWRAVGRYAKRSVKMGGPARVGVG